ncbi:hypothetical protein ACFQLX_14145 [Streptomyces polyrhachis]|uniref:Integration host factor n=1 Tax=Streptomyces polyrhachis TaxID=1282885 RepID=A0ABW2GHV9_9ACTN
MAASEETVDRLRKAVLAKNAAEQRASEARAELAAAMAEAMREGARQGDVVTLTGYTREHVRRLVRGAGVEASKS